jgi:hypothetical protein
MCKYSFHTDGRSGLRAFLRGMGSNDIFGGSYIYDRYSSPSHADYDALKNDWKKVGNDMKNAINSFTKDQPLKLNGTR